MRFKNTRLLALLFVVTCFTFKVSSNEVLFSSGFENEILTEWASILNAGMTTFEVNTTAKHTGTNGLQMKFSAASQKGNLNTPTTINWEAGESYELSFWYKGVDPSDNGSTNIKLFLADKTKIYQIAVSNWNNSEWTQFKGTYVSEHTGAGYALFSFRPNNAGAGEYLLDDFKIEKVVVKEDMFTNLKTKKVRSDTTLNWVQFGPGMSGNNKSAFWHPTDENALYIGPNMGNSYASFDKGLTYSSTLNEDESDFKQGYRGPIEYTSVDFSRQNPDFGMCTDERNSGIYITDSRGKKWTHLPTSTFNGKYVDALAVDPKDDNIWYAGGGRLRNLGSNLYPNSQPKGTLAHSESLNKIWKSTNKGATWTLRASGLQAETGIETLLVDPKNSAIVYASTSTGFYKSTNAGLTWEEKNNGLDYTMLRSLTKHYDEANDVLTLFVMSNPIWKGDGNTITDDKGGIFKSIDRGETWIKLPGAEFNMTQFQSNYDIKKSYFHCAAYVFDMTDAAFEAAYPLLPSKITMRWNTLEVDPNDVNNLYANNEYSNASRNNFKPGQVWRSKDGGQTWHVTLRNGKAWNQGSADYSFWAGRANPMTTNIHLRYLDEWVNRDVYDRKGCNFVKFNADGTVLHTQMAKISLFSYDKGETWLDIDDEYTTPGTNSIVGAGNSNVPGHGFYQHPDIKNKVFCMAGENQLAITNNDGYKVRPGAQAATSVRIVSDETSLSAYAVHPKDTNIHYSLFFRQAKKGKLMRTTNNGKTWVEYGTAIPSWDTDAHSGDQSVHQNHLTIDPINTNNMYFVVPKNSRNIEYVGNSVTGFGFHKSNDGGKTWMESNAGLPDSKDATMVAIDPTNTNTIYVAIQNTGGGLFKSTNNGDSWIEVSSTQSISGSQGINDIQFARDGKVYITAGSKNGSVNDGGVWVSENNMANWTKIFDYPWTNRIETAYYNPNSILVSTLPNTKIGGLNAGTYLSQDGGKNWIKINKGNGQSDRINDIAIDNHQPGKFYASTYGSGWYSAQIPSPNPVVAAEGLSLLMDTLHIMVGTDSTLIPKFSPSFTYNQKVTWNSNDETIATVENGKIHAVKTGTTSVKVVSEDGGFETDIIVNVGVNTGIKNIEIRKLTVYPNPTNEMIIIKGLPLNANGLTLNLYSISGQKVKSIPYFNVASSINVSDLDKGVYILKLKTTNVKYKARFVKN